MEGKDESDDCPYMSVNPDEVGSDSVGTYVEMNYKRKGISVRS